MEQQPNGAAPKFAGESIDLGGVTYVLPPLSIGALKAGLFDRIRALGGAEDNGFDLALGVEVVHAALKRNYPSLTMDVLDELPPTALRQIVAAFNTVVRLSGFQAKAAEPVEGNGAPE